MHARFIMRSRIVCRLLVCLGSLLAPAFAHASRRDLTGLEKLLERPLTIEERNYFGSTTKAVSQAIVQAFTKQRVACTFSKKDAQLGTDSPGKWVSDQGHFSPMGLEPLHWEFHMKCSSGHQKFSLEVELLATPRTSKTGAGMKQIDGDKNGTLQKSDPLGDNSTAIVSVGEQSDLDAEHLPPVAPGTLARVRSLEIFFDVEGTHAIDVAKQLDRAVLTSALKDLRQPPTPTLPVVTDEKSVGTESDRSAVENEVYLAAMAQLDDKHVLPSDVVVSEKTEVEKLDPSTRKQLVAVTGDLRPSLLDDFAQQNEHASTFPADLGGATHVTLFTETEEKSLFEGPQSKDGWKLFRQKYPKVKTGILTFSRVGLSRDRTQAMVYMGYQSDWLNGLGQMLFLQKKPGGTWEVLYMADLWIS
jgi:hypothetical protein